MASIPRQLGRSPRYDDVLSCLLSVQKHTGIPRGSLMKPRDLTLAWIERLGLDVSKTRYVHIAGTKGKGTTALYLEHMLQHYHRTNNQTTKIGCLTSPHVMSVRDRFRINSRPIAEEPFVAHFSSLWNCMQETTSAPPMPKYPGFCTLLGFWIFAAEQVEIAVIETGMGGETDSTNIITAPIACGITKIGMDHVESLGDTAEKIAWHKAGIFKPGVPAFSVPQDRGPASVLRQRADEKRISLEFITEERLVECGVRVVPDEEWQRQNAALAVALAEACITKAASAERIDVNTVRCVETTPLPAKFETIEQGHITWILSSAHNEMSVEKACQAFVVAPGYNTGARRVLVFNPKARLESDQLFATVLKQVPCVAGQKFHNVIFCSNVQRMSKSVSNDPVAVPDTSGDAHHRYEAIWQQFQGGNAIKSMSSVADVVEYVRNEEEKTVVFVVGNSHLAGPLLLFGESTEDRRHPATNHGGCLALYSLYMLPPRELQAS